MKIPSKKFLFIILSLFLICTAIFLIIIPHLFLAPPVMALTEDEFMSQIDNIARDREWCGILPEFQEFLDSCEKERVTIKQMPEYEMYIYTFSETDFLKFFPTADSAISITETNHYINISYDIYSGKALTTNIGIDKMENRIDSIVTMDFMNSVQYYFKTVTGKPGVLSIEKTE